MPEPARRLPRLHSTRPLPRAVAHLAVVGLLAFTAVAGFVAQHPQDASAIGLSFDVVGAAHGAATQVSLGSAHFALAPDPRTVDPLFARRVLPDPTPDASPMPAATPKATMQAPANPAPLAVRTAVIGNGTLLWPVPGGVITQYFSAYHPALDIAHTAGSAVVAAAAGKVISAGWRDNGGGYVIEIDHGNGMHTLYNHLGAIAVGVGAIVSRGQRIASVGCTGNCTGPHVHFQVMIGGVFVNPLRYL